MANPTMPRPLLTDRGVRWRIAILLASAILVGIARAGIGDHVSRRWAMPLAIAVCLPMAAALDAWLGPRHTWRYHLGRLALLWAILAIVGLLTQ